MGVWEDKDCGCVGGQGLWVCGRTRTVGVWEDKDCGCGWGSNVRVVGLKRVERRE